MILAHKYDWGKFRQDFKYDWYKYILVKDCHDLVRNDVSPLQRITHHHLNLIFITMRCFYNQLYRQLCSKLNIPSQSATVNKKKNLYLEPGSVEGDILDTLDGAVV